MLRAIIATLAFIPTIATAQSLDFLSSNGTLNFGYSNRAAGADVFLTGDVTTRLSFGRFGAELGVYGRADALDTPHETYGTLTLEIGQHGRASIGVPRPAYDLFASSELERHFPALAVDRTAQTRSAATFGAMFAGWLPFGASFTNQTGDTSYALSYHNADGAAETVVGFGLALNAGGVEISAAIESVSGDVSGKVKISGPMGPAHAGVAYFAPQGAGLSDLAEVFAEYEISPQWSLSGIAQIPLEGGSATAGVSGRYNIGENLAFSLGVASTPGSDTIVSGFLSASF